MGQNSTGVDNNQDNQLTQYPRLMPFSQGAQPIDTSVSYTPQGHTSKETSAQWTKDYQYNAAERLIRYASTNQGQSSPALEASYRYDPFGRRIAKSVKEGGTTKTVYFLYGEQGLMGEADEKGKLTKAYGFNPIAASQGLWSTDPIWQANVNNGSLTDSSSSVYYLHTDHLGTPQLATTKEGQTSWKAQSEAFGAAGILQNQSSITMNLRFPGQYFDQETGSHYNFNRDYKPNQGRYVQSDPIRIAGWVNIFDYAKNNPHIYVDTRGLAEAAMAALRGTMEMGFYAGIVFDTFIQAGQMAIFESTDGASGKADFSMQQALVSGAAGAALTPLMAQFTSSVASKFQRAPEIMDSLFAKLGELTGLSGSRAKVQNVASEIGGSTQISVSAGAASKVFAQTPRQQSATLQEMVIWLRQEVAKINASLDTTLTLQAQVEQAWQLRELMTDGAKAALYDQSRNAPTLGAQAYFEATLRLPPLTELRQRISAQNNNLSGDALDRAVLAEITRFDRDFYSPEAQSCFPKGTLVHTKNGLMPIEKIQVGDWVLSKPEDGTGEVGYKQVTQTFAHPPAMVVAVEYTFGERPKDWTPLDSTRPFILATLNHPIWTMEDGWLEVDYLRLMRGKESSLLLANGRHVKMVNKHAIFKTDRENIGWISSAFQDVHCRGAEWDFEANDLSASNVESPDWLVEYQHSLIGEDMVVPNEVFQTAVFNIEVEDWHTYFVGRDGIWVHNKNENQLIQGKSGSEQN